MGSRLCERSSGRERPSTRSSWALQPVRRDIPWVREITHRSHHSFENGKIEKMEKIANRQRSSCEFYLHR